MKEHYEMYVRHLTEATGFDTDTPHIHHYHEIFMLLEGNADYLVEGTVFPMQAGDTVIVSAGDPHSKYLKGCYTARIFVLNVEREFFVANSCEEYEHIFNSKDPTEHKIGADEARRSGLEAAFRRLYEYSEKITDRYSAISKSAVTEFLYLLNKNSFSENFIENPHVRSAVEYINKNFPQKISLDDLERELFLSRYYICKLFRRYTGTTPFRYITQKRLTNVRRLVKAGYGITEACMLSGFSDYSAFYNAFTKEYGGSPRELL